MSDIKSAYCVILRLLTSEKNYVRVCMFFEGFLLEFFGFFLFSFSGVIGFDLYYIGLVASNSHDEQIKFNECVCCEGAKGTY